VSPTIAATRTSFGRPAPRPRACTVSACASEPRAWRLGALARSSSVLTIAATPPKGSSPRGDSEVVLERSRRRLSRAKPPRRQEVGGAVSGRGVPNVWIRVELSAAWRLCASSSAALGLADRSIERPVGRAAASVSRRAAEPRRGLGVSDDRRDADVVWASPLRGQGPAPSRPARLSRGLGGLAAWRDLLAS
jgi:hypothetical protein